jgi:hypothetical protein
MLSHKATLRYVSFTNARYWFMLSHKATLSNVSFTNTLLVYAFP